MGNSVAVAGASANSSLSRLPQQLLQRLEQQQPVTEEQRQRLADYPFLQAVGCLYSSRWSSSLVCVSPSEGLVFCKLHANPLTGGALAAGSMNLRSAEPDWRLTQQTQLLQKAAMSFDIHPNLLPVDRVLVTEQSVCTVRPFLSRSLPELQRDQLALCLDLRLSKLFVSFQLVCGVVQLHSLGFSHGNLSPQNVLVDSAGFAFLSDAASSRSLYSPSSEAFQTTASNALLALELAPPGPLRQAPEIFGGFEEEAVGENEEETNLKAPIEGLQQQDVFALACVLAEIFSGGGEVMDLLCLLQLKRKLLAKRELLFGQDGRGGASRDGCLAGLVEKPTSPRPVGEESRLMAEAETNANANANASMKAKPSHRPRRSAAAEFEISSLFEELKAEAAAPEMGLPDVSRCCEVPASFLERLVQAVPCKRLLAVLLFGVFLRQPEERLSAFDLLKVLERRVFPPAFKGVLICLRILLLHPVYQQPDLRLQLLMRHLPHIVAALLATRPPEAQEGPSSQMPDGSDATRTLEFLSAAARRDIPEEDSSVVFQSLLTLTENLPSEVCFTKQLFDAWTDVAAQVGTRAAGVASVYFSGSSFAASAESASASASASAAAAAASNASLPHPRLSLLQCHVFTERLVALWTLCRQGCVAQGKPVLHVLSSLEGRKVEMFNGLFETAPMLTRREKGSDASVLSAYVLSPSELVAQLLDFSKGPNAPSFQETSSCAGCLRTDLVSIPAAVIGVSVQQASSARLRIGGLHAIAFLCRFASTNALVEELVPTLIKGMEDPTPQIRATSVSLLSPALIQLERALFHDRHCKVRESYCSFCRSPCGIGSVWKTRRAKHQAFDSQNLQSNVPDVALLFSDWIAPTLERLGGDSSAAVRSAVAASLPSLLQVVRRCCLAAEASSASSFLEAGERGASESKADEEGDTQSGSSLPMKASSFADSCFDRRSSRLQRLHCSAKSLLRRLFTGSRPDDLLPLLQTQQLARLASFLGSANVQRFLLPHLTVLLNGRDSALRAAVARALGCLGGQLAGSLRSEDAVSTESWLLPCLEQCLSDPADVVAAASACALSELAISGCLDIASRRLLSLLRRRVVPLLLGPSRLVRSALLQLLAALESSSRRELSFALLLPLLVPVMRRKTVGTVLSVKEASSFLRDAISCSLWQRLLCLERHSPLASAISSPEALGVAERVLCGFRGRTRSAESRGEDSSDCEEGEEEVSVEEEAWELWCRILRAVGGFDLVEKEVRRRIAEEGREVREGRDGREGAKGSVSTFDDYFGLAEAAASSSRVSGEGVSLELRSLLRLLRGLDGSSQYALLLLLGPLAAQRAAAARGCFALCPGEPNFGESLEEAAFASSLQSCDLRKGISASPLCCSVDSAAECCLLEEFAPLVRFDGIGNFRRDARMTLPPPLQLRVSLASVWMDTLLPLCMQLAFKQLLLTLQAKGASSKVADCVLNRWVGVAAEAASAVGALAASQFQLNTRPSPPLLFAMLGVEFLEGVSVGFSSSSLLSCVTKLPLARAVQSIAGVPSIPLEAFACVVASASFAAARAVAGRDGGDLETAVVKSELENLHSSEQSAAKGPLPPPTASRSARPGKGVLLVPQALSRDFRCALLGLPSKFHLAFLPAPERRTEGGSSSLLRQSEGTFFQNAKTTSPRNFVVDDSGVHSTRTRDSSLPSASVSAESSSRGGGKGGGANASVGRPSDGSGFHLRDQSTSRDATVPEGRRSSRVGQTSRRFDDWRPRGQWLLNLNDLKAYCSGTGGRVVLLGAEEGLLFAASLLQPKAAAALWKCEGVGKGLRPPLVGWWGLPPNLQLTSALGLGNRAVALAASDGSIHVLRLDAPGPRSGISSEGSLGGGSSFSTSGNRLSTSVPGVLLRIKTPCLQVAPLASSPLAVWTMQREALRRIACSSSSSASLSSSLCFSPLASESLRLSRLFLRRPFTQSGFASLANIAASTAAASVSSSSAVECLALASTPFQDELFFLQQSGLFGSWDLRTGGGGGDFGGFVFPPWFGSPSALAVHPQSLWAAVGTASGFLALLDLRMRRPVGLWRLSPCSAVKQLLVVDSVVAAAACNPFEALSASLMEGETLGVQERLVDTLSERQLRLCCCVVALLHGSQVAPLLLLDLLSGTVLSAYVPSCLAASSETAVPSLKALPLDALLLATQGGSEAVLKAPPNSRDTAHAPLCLWSPSVATLNGDTSPGPYFLSAGEDRVVRLWDIAEYAAVGAVFRKESSEDSEEQRRSFLPFHATAKRLNSALVKSYAVCGPASLCGCRGTDEQSTLRLLCAKLDDPTETEEAGKARCSATGGRVFYEICEHSCAFQSRLGQKLTTTRKAGNAKRGDENSTLAEEAAGIRRESIEEERLRRSQCSRRDEETCMKRDGGGGGKGEEKATFAFEERDMRCSAGSSCCSCNCTCVDLQSAKSGSSHRLTPGSWAPLWVSGQSGETGTERRAHGDETLWDSGPSVHHRDAIVCMTGVAGEVNLLATAGRDNVVKLWM